MAGLFLKKNKVKEVLLSAVCIVAIFLIAFLFSFTARSQFLTPMDAYTDSSVFQYIARVMLKGGVPYRDVFDHKGPLLYFINAFALWLSRYKGLWFVEFLVLFFSFFSMYRLSRLFCNKITSVLVVIASVPILNLYFEGGNLTEEYALPFIAGALYIFSDFFLNKKITWFRLILCGAFLGFVLMLRVNMVAVWIVMCLGVLVYCLYEREYKKIFYYLGYFMLGLVISILPFIIWLASKGALQDFWNSYILFNFAYSSDGQRANIYSKLNSFLHFFYEPYAVVGCGIIVVSIFKKKRFLNVLYLFCLLSTLLLICISGQNYWHYGMVLVPIFIIPLAYIGKTCDNAFEKNQLGTVFLVTYILVSTVLPTWERITENAIDSYKNRGSIKTTANVYWVGTWLEENTQEDETIVVCGNWNAIYNQSNRFAPSKYSYQFPIGAIEHEIERQFFEDISKNKPVAIVLPIDYYAKDKMMEFINTHNYTRVYVDNVGDYVELYVLK